MIITNEEYVLLVNKKTELERKLAKALEALEIAHTALFNDSGDGDIHMNAVLTIDAALAAGKKTESAMSQHEPRVCEKVPYTAYYSSNKWSCSYRCPQCGNTTRLTLDSAVRFEILCDGVKIESAPIPSINR